MRNCFVLYDPLADVSDFYTTLAIPDQVEVVASNWHFRRGGEKGLKTFRFEIVSIDHHHADILSGARVPVAED